MESDAPIRKRLRRWEHGGDCRFVTFSCYKRLPLLGNPRIRDAFSEVLEDARRRLPFELFAWVTMPEHVHVLARVPRESDWHTVALHIKPVIARRVVQRWKTINAPILEQIIDAAGRCRFWQRGGGFDRNIRNDTEFSETIRYVHRNPVERGLVERPEDWQWSSVRWWMGERDGAVKCDPPPGEKIEWDKWRGFM